MFTLISYILMIKFLGDWRGPLLVLPILLDLKLLNLSLMSIKLI